MAGAELPFSIGKLASKVDRYKGTKLEEEELKARYPLKYMDTLVL